MDLDKTIGYQIKSVWHSVSKMYNHFAEGHSLTFTMALVLLSLDDKEGLPSTHIGPSVGLEPRSLTRLLKKMEDDGLISKLPSKEDKRQVYVFLTETGVEKRDIAEARIKAFNDQVNNELEKEDIESFLKVINKVKQIAKQNI